MTEKVQSSEGTVYQIKVTLKDSEPPIWRSFQVTGDTNLYELHQAIQVVMGWDDYHLHEFIVDGLHYGVPDPEYVFEMNDETRFTLSQVVGAEQSSFTYEYDFGDGWGHALLVEKILPPEPGVRYPICLTGKRACPPEDCGGIWGYGNLLEIIRDPEDSEYEDTIEWLREGFDPEVVAKVTKMIDKSEYKRRQAPPGVKITSRAFGKDWRLPITNWYKKNS